ncbi:hypothetical protein [Aeromicrobium ginsengisoli]|uniref:Uncharacterized protein n=1 Tax=Aeromicrobium ginsengisoli TaxID=363867 RepID=A0A5M4FG56_9ACTN|nr:hypothetical protein [Aeromicrobium ginsengisoli]KAA1397851.1 hypothetical protein ESP70_010940 [Aeromicrobium ginsengisoli]
MSLRRLALLSTAMLLGSVGLELLAAGPSAAQVSPRCATALALVDQGKPQTAAALVDTIRKDAKDRTLCTDAETAAVAAINAARGIVRSSERRADGLNDPPSKSDEAAWKQIKQDAQKAQASDSENPDGAALEKRATSALDTIDPDDWWTVLLERGKAWKDLAKDHADEWAGLVGAAIGAVALILLAARLLLLLPLSTRFPPRRVLPLPSWTRFPRLRIRKWWGRPETAAALTIPVAAAVTAGWLPSWLDAGAKLRTGVLAVLVLASVFFAWCWLYHRQRVVIEMLDKGKPSPAGATAVVAHLRRLGASPPRGLEIPLGADAQTLAASNITAGGLAGKFVKQLQTALAVTPWRIRVDRASDSEVQIIISRHGRVVASEVLLPQPAVAGIKLDHEKLAAAYVLTTVLEALKNFSGMAGAKDWLSVGLHYDATTGDHTRADKITLLSRAVTVDPDNWAAQMTYRFTLDSTSDEQDTLWALVTWLYDAADAQEAGDTALKLRMLYASYATRLNWNIRHLPRGTGPSPTAKEIQDKFEATVAKADLDDLFKERIEAAAEAMFDPRSFEKTSLRLDPQTAYARACHAAQSENADDQAKAVELLRFAGPRFQAQVGDDVSLRSFVTTRTYLDEFGADPRSDVTELVPYSTAKDRLTLAGLTVPEALTSLTQRDLANTARISKSAATAWLLRAQVPLRVPSSLYEFRLEVSDVLAGHGVVSPASLERLRADAGRTKAASADVIASLKTMKGYTVAHEAAVEAWLPPD